MAEERKTYEKFLKDLSNNKYFVNCLKKILNLENISADDYENIKKGMKTIEDIPPGEALEIFHECLEANFDKEIKKENREFQTIFNYCFHFLKNLTEEKKKEELRISKEQLQVSILQKKMEELKPRETDDANEKKRKIDDFEIIFKENSKQIKFDSWSAPKKKRESLVALKENKCDYQMINKFSGDYYDGIKTEDPLKIERTETLEKLIEQFSKGKTIIRSSPLTGKTSLIQLLFRYLFEKKNIKRVCMLSFLSLKSTSNKREDPELKEFWRKKCIYSWEIEEDENDWEALLNSKNETYILLDETQMIYERAELFWESVRQSLSVKLLCFAFYDQYFMQHPNICSPTHILQNSLTLSSILLTRKEYDTLIELFNTQNKKMGIMEEIKDFMFTELGGHIGLIKATLNYFLLNMKYIENPIESDFYECLLSFQYLFYLMGLRCYSSRIDFEQFMEIMCLILDADNDKIEISNLTQEQFQKAINLEKCGFFVKDKDNWCFQLTAPIIGRMLKFQLKSGVLKANRSSIPTNTIDGFHQFLKAALSLINPQILKNQISLSSKETIIERVFQNEFYHVVTSIIPNKQVCPDVGRAFGSKGFLDLYVNHEYKWGIELARDGIELEEHIGRFDKINGKYRNIPMKFWVILDFNDGKKVKDQIEKSSLHPNVWKVLYFEDKLTIMKNNDEFDLKLGKQ